MLFKNMIFIPALAAVLSACAATPPDEPHPYQDYLDHKGLELPKPESFDHCRGYGRAFRDRVSLGAQEWKKITKLFAKAKTAEDERAALSQAVATLEQIVGEIRRHAPSLRVELVDARIMNQLSYEVSDGRFRSTGFRVRGNLARGIADTMDLLKGIRG